MSEQGDLIHKQVLLELKEKPEYLAQLKRVGEGEYQIDARVVKVGFCRQGFLVVHDGPLRQPLVDYVGKKESTAIYHHDGLKTSSLNAVPKATRISFGDEGERYTRLDAMKVAKEQALVREKAATCMAEGQMVPADLREKYEKTMDIKLGKRRMSAMAPQQISPPAWWPGTASPSMPAPAPVGAAAMPVRPPSFVPSMAATSPKGGGGLFGQVPNLFDMAAARIQPPVASMPVSAPKAMPVVSPPAVPMLATVSMPAGGYTATVKAPMMSAMQQRTRVAGLYGA